MRVESIEKLLKFILELKLLSQRNDGTLILAKSGRNCLASDDAFDRQLRSSLKSFLERNNLPLSRIGDTISKIKYPRNADAKTIYEELPEEKTRIGAGRLRSILFILYKCKGINRKTNIRYSLNIE